MYSMPRDLMTSTMKSDPLRSGVSTSTGEGVPASASGDIGGGAPVRGAAAGCAAPAALGAVTRAAASPPPPAALGAVTSAAAPAAAFFRKSRRLTDVFLEFAMDAHPCFDRHI